MYVVCTWNVEIYKLCREITSQEIYSEVSQRRPLGTPVKCDVIIGICMRVKCDVIIGLGMCDVMCKLLRKL